MAPPFGIGSLRLLVGADSAIIAFGNEVDYLGMPVSDVTEVGFRVFITGEDADRGDPIMSLIAFEIDPGLLTDYSSLVWRTV